MFYQSIGDGVVGGCADELDTKELHEVTEEVRLKLTSSVEGVPKRAIQPEMEAQATVSAVISGIGMDLGQCVKWSMQVSRYVYPLEGGRGPTRM